LATKTVTQQISIMKIKSLTLIAAAFLYLMSCSESSKDNTAGIQQAEPISSSTDTSLSIAPASSIDNNVELSTLPQTEQPASGTDVALNPAHGLPGHRCEIPVGAPLNSAPANTGNSASQVQVAPTATAAPAYTQSNLTPVPTLRPAAVQGAGSGRVNPPHGQAGHDCGIPVGAPLNAAPANANATQVNTVPQPGITPVPTFNPSATQGTVTAGINPPHGQPGHDCGIPVGAPLNK
jgi:hypothetical protein